MSILRVDWNPAPHKLRIFGFGLIVLAIVLFAMAWLKGRPASGRWVLAAGTSLGLITLVSPGLGRWIYRAWMGVAFLIGSVVSTLILALIYYGLIAPIGVCMRLAGRDPLRLKDRRGDTYWQALQLPEDKTYYERLF